MAKIAEFLKKIIIHPAKKAVESFWLYYHNGSVYRKLFLAIFGLFLIADLLTVLWGMPNFASWSPDDQSGPFIIGFAKYGAYKYAAGGYIINLILYAPVLLFYLVTGTWHLSNPKYPDFGFSEPHWQLGFLIILSRLLSFAFYLGAGYFLYLTLRRFGKRLACLAAFLYMLAPIVVEFSTYGNLDAPIMFFSALCFYALAEIFFSVQADEEKKRTRNWLIFFISLAAISSIKEPNAFTFVLPFLFLLGYKAYLSRSGIKKALSEVLPGILSFFISFTILTGLFWDFSGYVAHIKRWIGPTSVSWNDYQRLGIGGVSLRTLESLALGAPAVLFLAVLGIFLIYRLKKHRVFFSFVLLFPLSFWFLSLASVGLVYLRYVIVLIFFLAIPAAFALSYFWDNIKILKKRYLFLAALIFLFVLASAPVYGKFNDSRYQTEKFILNSVKGKHVQVLSGRYQTYLPRMEKLRKDKKWTAESIVFSPALSAVPDRDLYIVEYEKFSAYREVLAENYGIIYDSGPKYLYYHAFDPSIEPCRVSCRTLILERKDGGAIIKPIDIDENINSYYDQEQ